MVLYAIPETWVRFLGMAVGRGANAMEAVQEADRMMIAFRSRFGYPSAGRVDVSIGAEELFEDDYQRLSRFFGSQDKPVA
jgi:hypothetical protein